MEGRRVSLLDECWEWNGARSARGYGKKKIMFRDYTTHRLAYAWANGPIPAGMLVMHTCDNPPCCNPRHLRLGTHLDNQRDKAAKGRHPEQARTECPQG